MRIVELLLARIRPEHERAAKGQAIADLEVRTETEIKRADELISKRLASYQSVRLRR